MHACVRTRHALIDAHHNGQSYGHIMSWVGEGWDKVRWHPCMHAFAACRFGPFLCHMCSFFPLQGNSTCRELLQLRRLPERGYYRAVLRGAVTRPSAAPYDAFHRRPCGEARSAHRSG